MSAALTVATGEGIAFQLVNWKFVTVAPTSGEPFAGHLISEGPDYYIFVTKDWGNFLPPSSISEIRLTSRSSSAKMDRLRTDEAWMMDSESPTPPNIDPICDSLIT